MSGIRMNNVTQKVTYRQSVFLLVFIVEENKIYLYSVQPLQYEDLAHHSINIIKHNMYMAYMIHGLYNHSKSFNKNIMLYR